MIGVSMLAKVTQEGGNSYSFQFTSTGANLAGIVSPVKVVLTMGDDTGTTFVNM
jgi:hypothetical protein